MDLRGNFVSFEMEAVEEALPLMKKMCKEMLRPQHPNDLGNWDSGIKGLLLDVAPIKGTHTKNLESVRHKIIANLYLF